MTTPIAASTILPQAFRLMEVAAPSSFEDGSEKSTAAREQYGRARDMVLEAYDWSDARWVWQLSEFTPSEHFASDPELPFAVRLPSECLSLRYVYNGGDFRWRLDGRILRADRQPPLTIRGTRRIERETALHQTLQLAIAFQLAALLSPRFVGSRTKRSDIKSDLADAVATAKRMDSHSASISRIDGQANEQTDWVAEALK